MFWSSSKPLHLQELDAGGSDTELLLPPFWGGGVLLAELGALHSLWLSLPQIYPWLPGVQLSSSTPGNIVWFGKCLLASALQSPRNQQSQRTGLLLLKSSEWE